MTDRIHALTVVLDEPVRSDDIEPVIAAIMQIRHVLNVRPHVADFETYAAQERARVQLAKELIDVLKPR